MGTPNWNDNLLLPYESNWSAQNKIGYVEGYTVKLNSKSSCSMNRSQQIDLSNKLSLGRYCPECAKHGYHAIFHQFVFLDNCLLHPEQKLLSVEYPQSGVQPESFFQKIGTRAIDVILNEPLRQAIEVNISFDFDKISVIDLLEHNGIFKNGNGSLWYQTTLTTLKEYISGRPKFSSARKIASFFAADDVHTKILNRWIGDYIENNIVPRWGKKLSVLKMDLKEISCEATCLQRGWGIRTKTSPETLLYLMMHKEYVSICDHIGGPEKLENIIFSIYHNDERIGLDTKLCDVATYSRVIALILVTKYCTPIYFERLCSYPMSSTNVPSLSNTLNLLDCNFRNHIEVRETNKMKFFLPILSSIFEDIFTHAVPMLTDLITLLGGKDIQIHSNFFNFPVSQYVAIWKNGNVEVWACDPNFNELAEDIMQRRKEFREKTIKGISVK